MMYEELVYELYNATVDKDDGRYWELVKAVVCYLIANYHIVPRDHVVDWD